MILNWFRSNKHRCSFERLEDSTDEHYYLNGYYEGFNMSIYKYSLELYKCKECGKTERKKFKWITLPNTGKAYYLN